MQDPRAVSTGCTPIDDLLGGGFDRGAVAQVYGPPSAGKTNLVLSTAVSTAATGGRAVVIDTEGVSRERFAQIADGIGGQAHDEILSRVLFEEVHDFGEQTNAVKSVKEVAPETDVILLDSATGFYRLERVDESESSTGDALRRLADQIAHLLGLARRYELAVVITNQVFTDPDSDEIRPLGGYTLEHWSSTILRLERFRGGNRRVVLEKHRSREAGDAVLIKITATGLTAANVP